MEEVRDGFISRAEEYLGLKIQYGSMGPSMFGVLDIRNIRMLRDDSSVFLGVSRLRLSYSFAELLKGNIASAFHSVRIDQPVLNFDFERDLALIEHIVSPYADSGAGRALRINEILPENFSVRILNGEWDAAGSAGRIRLSNLRFDASIRQSRISFNGRWSAAGSFHQTGPGSLFAFSGDSGSGFGAEMSARFSGEYSQNTGEGSAIVRIPSLSGNHLRLKPADVGIFLSGPVLEIRNIHGDSPAAVSLIYNLEERSLSGSLEANNFSLQDMLSFTGSWREFNPALAFRISGYAGLETKSSGSANYEINFSGSLPPDSSAGQAVFNIKAKGNGEQLTVEKMDILSPYGTLDFSGGLVFDPVAPYGLLTLSDLRLNTAGFQVNPGISGNFSIGTQGNEINIFSENLTAGTVAFSALDLSLFREEQGLAFVFSVQRDAGMSALFLEGSADYDPRQIRASMRLDSFSAGDILGILEPIVSVQSLPSFIQSAAADLRVSTELFFNTDYENILYNAPHLAVAYQGFGDILAAASLSGTGRKFELSEGLISWQKGNAEIAASVDISDINDIAFSLNTRYRDFSYFFEGMILNKRNVNVRGSYGIQAFLGDAGAGSYSGFAQGENIPFASGDNTAAVSFLLSVDYFSPSSWRGDIGKFEISDFSTPSSANNSLAFTGFANERGAAISNIFFINDAGPLNGEITIEWDPGYTDYRFGAEIFGNNSIEHYDLGGTYRDKRLELALSVLGMQFSRVSAINAVIDGDLRLSWESPESFEAEITVSSFALSGKNGQLHASAQANMNNERFIVNSLNAGYEGLTAYLPYFRIDRAASLLETAVFIRGSFSDRLVDISLKGDARFNSTGAWLDMARGIGFFDGTLIVDTARYDTIEAKEPFEIEFSCQKEKDRYSVNLSGGPRNMIRFRYSPEETEGGNFYAALSAPSPVRGSVAGYLDSKTIDAQGNDIYVDLGSLWRFVPPNDAIAFPGGIATAAIRVSGSLADPEFYGAARGTGIQIMVPKYIREPIRLSPVTIYLTGAEMNFGPVKAAAGSGMGEASAWFRFDRWIPNIFNIDILVPNDSPVPYGLDISGVMAGGLASGKLILDMEDLILSVKGDITAYATVISVNANEIMSQENDWGDSENRIITVMTDISIRTGRRVEFFWPSVEFPILQAYTDMGTGIKITSDEFSRRFTLTGDVMLRSGEIFYLERNFYIREGTLFFRETEIRFDPRISARAEIRDRVESGPVTISMIIDNAPLMSFIPRFISTPPLSQMEIYSVLGQNPQGDEIGGRNIAASVILDSLAQFTLMRRVQRVVRDFLGLDMFSVRTQLIQNVFLQATGLQQDYSTLERPFRAGNYFDNTTVFMGRYIGSDLFGQAMVSFKYDENKLNWGGVILEPEIGLEMRNPLFDIQFNLIPLHPETWFVSDASFSLIWRRSF
jgi:hypothetical protein